MSRWYCRSVFRSPDGCRFPCADRAAGKSQDRLAGGRSMDPCLCARPACRSQRIGAVVHADDQRLVAGEDGKVGSLFREPGQFFQMRLHDIGKRRRRVDAERDAHQTCPRDVFRAANVTGNAGFSQRSHDTERRSASQAGRTGDLRDGDRIDRRSQMLQCLKSPGDGRIEILHPCRIGFSSVHILTS